MEQRLIDANALSKVMGDRLILVSVKCGMDSARAMEAAKAMAIVNAQPTIETKSDPEMEYRKAKAPFFMTHRYIDAETKKEGTWVSTHCPVCFWNEKVGLWDSMIDRGTPFCSRCGQKIEWEKEHAKNDNA